MPVELQTGDLLEWLRENSRSLQRISDEMFPVILTPDKLAEISLDDLAHLDRQPINKQVMLIKAGRWAIQQKRPLIFCVEQGGGKTFITTASLVPFVLKARAEGKSFLTIIVAPKHLSHKWYKEIRMVIPDAKIRIVHRAADLLDSHRVEGVSYKPIPKRKRRSTVDKEKEQENRYPNASLEEAEFLITDYHSISLSARMIPSANNGWLKNPVSEWIGGRVCTVNMIAKSAKGKPDRVLVCPDCGATIMDKEEYMTPQKLASERRFCSAPKMKRVEDEKNGRIWKPGVATRYRMEPVLNKRGEQVRCGGALWQFTADPLDEPHNGNGMSVAGKPDHETPRPPAWNKLVSASDGKVIAYPSPTAQQGKALPLRPLGAAQGLTLKAVDKELKVVYSGPRKMDLAIIFQRQFGRHINVAVVDEGHLAKSGDSARGMSVGNICALADSTLMLTGTLSGGYSSTLFFLLWRFTRAIRKRFGYDEVSRWVEQYGVRQITTRETEDGGKTERFSTGKQSRKKAPPPQIREIPGISAQAMPFVLGDAVFASLSEIFPYPLIPHFTDKTPAMGLDTTQSAVLTYKANLDGADGDEDTLEEFTDTFTQKTAYQKISAILTDEMKAMLLRGDKGLLAITLQTMLRWPNASHHPIQIKHPRTGQVFLEFPGLPEEWLFPKEEWLLERCHQWKNAGHRTIVYVSHVGEIDVAARLKSVLERPYQGKTLKVALLRSTTTETEERGDWIEEQVDEGADVLICNPQLVETGLDLIQFSRVVMYQMIYSTYTLQQCVRRVLRPKQLHDVEVHYPQYHDAFEILAAKLMAQKALAAAQVAGRDLSDVFMKQAGTPDLQTMFINQVRSGIMQAVDVHEIEAMFQAATQKRNDAEAAEVAEYQTRFQISPEGAQALMQLAHVPDDDPFADLFDMDEVENIIAALSAEDLMAIFNPPDDAFEEELRITPIRD